MHDRAAREPRQPAVEATPPEAFTRLVTEFLPQIIRLTDVGGGALYLNAQWERYTGLSVPLSLGLGWQQALHPDDRPLFVAAWASGVTTGRDFIIEYRLRRADGAYRWFESHAVPAVTSGPSARAWLSSLTDIDARREAERERDAVLSAIVHDLRSPLTALVGRTQLLQRRLTRLTEPAALALAGDLERLVGSGQQMATMVAELADLARLSRGTALDLDRTETDLVALVQNALADAEQSFHGRIVHFEPRVSDLIAEVDAARLTRVVANLAGNALKYSEPPSTVTVTLEREQRDGRCWAVLCVKDQGISIPSDELARVGERFYRASNAIGRAPGTGIGLSGVKQIVEQHGGNLDVASREGVGPSVSVRLPLVPVES